MASDTESITHGHHFHALFFLVESMCQKNIDVEMILKKRSCPT
jgi:hypothetical protein